MDRIYVFLILFSVVYFFEAIGGSYIISAVQNIERQFQIPSKTSGVMISASDIGYIPTVTLIAYLGSRGNRAKWIGGGTVMIAMTYLLIASPNFLFPVNAPELNSSYIERQLAPTESQLSSEPTLEDLLSYPLIYDRIPRNLKDELVGMHYSPGMNATTQTFSRHHNRNSSYVQYAVDGELLDLALEDLPAVLNGTESPFMMYSRLSTFVKARPNRTMSDLYRIRRSATAPFALCGKLVNSLRNIIKEAKCKHSSNFGPFVVFFTALFFLGIGRTMPWSLGVPLVDDNVKRKNLPAYFAGISFIRVLGPICGYIIGSFCNKLYYTLHPPAGLTANDPTWIGAWWIGFIVIGIVTLIPSVALFFFPSGKDSRLGNQVGEEKNQLKLFDKHNQKDKLDDDRNFKEKSYDFVKSYGRVLQTKIYTGSVLGRICDILAFKGYIVFLPKYLENHFGIPQYKVHQYMAIFGVFGFALGTIVGGFVTRRFKLNGRAAAMFVLVVSTVNLAIFFSKSFIACESIVNSIGVSVQETNYNFSRPCNEDCGCDGVRLFPVCDIKGNVFFSPCHAGCRDVHIDKHTSMMEFVSCDCAIGGSVRKEFCRDTCKVPTILFFATVLLGAFFAGMGVVPGLLILLRSVPPATRSLSLGLQGLLVSIFGTLPSPVLWGFVVDSACLVWDRACDGMQGTCSIYDPHSLRTRMHIMYTVIRLISMLTDIYVWYHAKGLNILEEDKEEEVVEDIVRKQSIRMNPLPSPPQ